MADGIRLSVGKVAQRSGVSVSALHFYERKGLIFSERNAGNQRQYPREVLRRVSLIKAAQALGISLEEVKTALNMLPGQRTPTASDWDKLASHWQNMLTARIAGLQRMNDLLSGCIGCGCLSMKQCPLYNGDDHLAKSGTGAVYIEQPDTDQLESP